MSAFAPVAAYLGEKDCASMATCSRELGAQVLLAKDKAAVVTATSKSGPTNGHDTRVDDTLGTEPVVAKSAAESKAPEHSPSLAAPKSAKVRSYNIAAQSEYEPDTEDVLSRLVSIRGLRKLDVLRALYDCTSLMGPFSEDKSRDEKEASAIVEDFSRSGPGASLYVDWLQGKSLRVDIGRDLFDPLFYDDRSSLGNGYRAIQLLRQSLARGSSTILVDKTPSASASAPDLGAGAGSTFSASLPKRPVHPPQHDHLPSHIYVRLNKFAKAEEARAGSGSDILDGCTYRYFARYLDAKPCDGNIERAETYGDWFTSMERLMQLKAHGVSSATYARALVVHKTPRLAERRCLHEGETSGSS